MTTNFLVVGGTGKTGRRVADRLRERGLPVRSTSRRGVPPFDWGDRGTWAPVLDGVGAVYLTYYPDLVVPGAAGDIRAFTDLAVAAGVRHLVLLSGRGEEEAEACEAIVRAAGTGWTILRCSWFAQNFSEHFLLDAVRSGEIVLPAGTVTEPFVDVRDIADVAVKVLTEPGHTGELYELTGPRLLSFADAATEIAATSGRNVRYVPVSAGEFAAAAAAQGVPEVEIGALTELFARVLDGRNSSVTSDVERVLGRPATQFADFARDAAAAGVWAR
ncbi:nucleotide-diphosphate-sugar epimerase/NmrA family protein [Amycolatopsis mediterranei S699]|uniref:Nucleotide-diphosphate-sugar epimerase/NmrA family protein n=2 Tax=Amycolatopsis mediterranei TaxID=33910 RepID=A0A0H3DA95_AMYMU|nr:NAD(P)H-binding protein [Amycolatopsis mediterranei]ADJ46464.1 nucleotide-diphosphate-sugar epimerase/NmrA family protein [Amycolatopsis mediterranei U32]AEK43262.1 nucleotide-diphosphate-sugar epimerase/NmrA family protein [Amycolatopsis mediterranei S699]AFO78175.1 nucleotide-diphosphate-sugar epimerase/NmrA family protein [Amycolatopsis mediterranei S699]AGT85303.1 nucleotide-diphosphate-sugar epimerase/NmrA family protein [Amycolatopsis mediterranei RB]KDO06299.1 NmrA family transcripti